MMKRSLLFMALALALALGPLSLDAAGTSSTKKDDGKKQYSDGLAAAYEGDYEQAIKLFTKVTKQDRKNADAFNMLGYSYRKLGDYDNALANYQRALDLAPDHLGANEYIGEAYIELGDLAKAEEHLAALARLCPGGCDEYDDLSWAVAAYKAANGG